MQGLGYEHDATYIPKIDAVEAEQIQQLAKAYFNNPAIAVVGPFEDIIQ